MASSTAGLLQRLHEQSQTEVITRARAQFQGSSQEFQDLAEEYDMLAPRLRGRTTTLDFESGLEFTVVVS